jgi:regulator of protease activity HflC (stomatin/prohibitin superfamily)
VLTADGNIAHTKWRVTYSRDPSRVAAYAQNVLPGENEQGLVRSAVKRGVVQAVAQVSIDDLLKQAAGEAGSVASRAKEIGQGVLDRMETGLRIDKLLLTEKMPPLYVREKFNDVQASESRASQKRDEARSESQRTLQQAAGRASGALNTLIGRFETAVEKNDPKGKDQYLGAINSVLEGEETRADDLEFPARLVSGEVTAMLSQARQYRSDNVNRARAELSRFQAKLSQFKASPLVLINREWADSLRVFYDRDFVQIMLAPKGSKTMELVINSDPSIIKELETAAKRAEGEKAQLERAIRQKDEQHKLESGLKATPH